jgi:hypothetical protein
LDREIFVIQLDKNIEITTFNYVRQILVLGKFKNCGAKVEVGRGVIPLYNLNF